MQGACCIAASITVWGNNPYLNVSSYHHTIMCQFGVDSVCDTSSEGGFYYLHRGEKGSFSFSRKYGKLFFLYPQKQIIVFILPTMTCSPETCSPLALVENPNNPFKSPLSISDMTPFIPSVFVLQKKISLPLWFLHKVAFNSLLSGFHGPQEISSYQWLTFLVNMGAKVATEAWEGFQQAENLILIHSLPIFSFSPLNVLFSPKLVLTTREEYFC